MEANNMAAVREAYEFAEEFLRDYGTDWKLHNKLCDMLKSALAAQLRNCDVGTAQERMYRYSRLRNEINERYKRLGEIPPASAFPTAFEWEDRPYEEGEADEGRQ